MPLPASGMADEPKEIDGADPATQSTSTASIRSLIFHRPSRTFAERRPLSPEAITEHLASKKDKAVFGGLVKKKDGKKVEDRFLVITKRRVYVFKSGGKVRSSPSIVIWLPLTGSLPPDRQGRQSPRADGGGQPPPPRGPSRSLCAPSSAHPCYTCQVTITFDKKSVYALQTAAADDIVRALRQAWRDAFPFYPEKAQFKLVVEPASRYLLLVLLLPARGSSPAEASRSCRLCRSWPPAATQTPTTPSATFSVP